MTVEENAGIDCRLDLIHVALGQQKDYYEVEIVETLEPAHSEILEVEGCPITLRRHVHNYQGPWVILRSTLLNCQHVMPLKSLEGVNFSVGIKSYCTNFFRIIKMEEDVDSLLRASMDAPTNMNMYTVEIQICHLLTDINNLWINNPKISSQRNKADKEFLLFSFQQEAGNGIPQPVFDLKRGRVTVKIMDHSPMNKVYIHDSNYDLTQSVVSGASVYKFVLMDQQTGNILTIGVRMGKRLVETASVQEDEMTLCFLKYEFAGPAVPSPMISPIAMIPPGLTMSPLQSPSMSQATPNLTTLSWLRTPGTQVLNCPTKMNDGGKMIQGQQYVATPEMPFTPGLTPGQSSPLLNGRQGIPPMSLTSPNLLPTSNPPMYHRTGNLLYDFYPSPNFQYMQSPAMGIPCSPLMKPHMMPGMMGAPAVELHSTTAQFNTMTLGNSQMNSQMGESTMMPLLSSHQMKISSTASEMVQEGVQQIGNSPIIPPMMSPAITVDQGSKHMQQHAVNEVDNERHRAEPSSTRSQSQRSQKKNHSSMQKKEANNLRNVPEGAGKQPHELIGTVVAMAKSKNGSRFVQKKLTDPEYRNVFFQELKDHVAELMMDNFGHYAIEALFQVSPDDQRLHLVGNLAPLIAIVSCHKQGSFSIQSIMESLQTQTEIEMIVEALSKHVMQIILNCSGHHVIIRFLSKFGWPFTRFVHRALVGHCYEFSTDHYGLRVMKAAVDAGPHSQLTNVFNCISKHTNNLVVNQYGNYIIQHLLDVCPSSITNTIKEKLSGQYVRFSKQKFSSNVVEKVIKHSKKETEAQLTRIKVDNDDNKDQEGFKDWRKIIVRELCAKAYDLISDKYGNYCLQTALNSASNDPELVRELTEAITPHLDTLRTNVKAKWQKLLENAQLSSTPTRRPKKNDGLHRNKRRQRSKVPRGVYGRTSR